MQHIHALQPIPPEGKYLFLAGSIEMGAAVQWQERVAGLLTDTDWIILNPRRGMWDPGWDQHAENPAFHAQVDWELGGLERSHAILLYFDPATKSPISLLELGLFARSGKLLVVCPEGYWRKGNVDVVCERYGVATFATIEEAVAALPRVDEGRRHA